MIAAVPDDRRCIVVGAGLLGLSAAWALSRRHWHVTVLEAADAVGHDRSGSKGDARIFRLGYPEPVYVEMAIRARTLWRHLEATSGRQLLHGCGQVTFGDEASLDAIAASLAAVGSPAERLVPGDAARRFPAIAVNGSVLFEPASCVLAADECLRALGAAADFVLRTGTRVTSLCQGTDSVTVATAAGQSFDADVVVDCAGPQALALLDDPWPVVAPPSLPQVAYFAPSPGATPREQPPIFIEWGDDMIYGLPGAHRRPARRDLQGLPSHPGHRPRPLRPRRRRADGRRPGAARPVDRRRPPSAAVPRPRARADRALRLRQLRRRRLRHRSNGPDRGRLRHQRARVQVRATARRSSSQIWPTEATPSIDLRPFGLHREPARPHGPAGGGS